MSIKVMSQVWQDEEITDATETLIMLALADYANDTGVCWPAWESIAKKARCSRSTVYRIVQALVAKKKLKVESHRGRHATNTYRLSLKTSHGETFYPETFHGDTKRCHRETKRCHSLTPDPSVPVKNPQPGGAGAARFPRIKGALTPQQLFWMINERLKSANGSARKKLLKERDIVLQAATGIDLTPEPVKEPASQQQPIDPPTEEDWKAGIDQLKAVVASAKHPSPKATPSNRRVKLPGK